MSVTKLGDFTSIAQAEAAFSLAVAGVRAFGGQSGVRRAAIKAGILKRKKRAGAKRDEESGDVNPFDNGDTAADLTATQDNEETSDEESDVFDVV